MINAANRWDDMWMADQQLAVGLSRLAPVLYVDPVQSLATRVRQGGWKSAVRRAPRLTVLGRRLARLEPEGLPGLARRGVAEVNARLAALQVRDALGRLGGSARASIEANVLTPVSGRIGESTKVYWAQDDFEAMAALVGGVAASYARADVRLAAEADLVMAANPRVAEALRIRGRETELIPFGCDAEHFARAAAQDRPEDIALPSPFAIFVGHLGDRLDFSLLEGLRDAGLRQLLIGPVHPSVDRMRFDALVASPEVQWLGSRPFDDLPAYLGHAAVALVPYTASAFNLASFPLKTLEYLAAGLPVVSTPLPGVEWIGSSDVHVAGDRDDFVSRVGRLLSARPDPAGVQRRQQLARGHSWNARARSVATMLGIEIEEQTGGGGRHAA
ncbi:glycosyltransferase [Sinomonas susongensis]|uniref:glycosyltransferase n=1 Tax=Sinomonas susongensis TaxID=1324851 RepID=UPI001485CCC2|nr:glycosyltransferase [Sinomonas susongensis]